MNNFSGSATAPLRVLKPKLASGSKKRSSHEGSLANNEHRMRSIEAEPNRLYQSLDSENVAKSVKREQVDDNSKQFESLEPSRTPLS